MFKISWDKRKQVLDNFCLFYLVSCFFFAFIQYTKKCEIIVGNIESSSLCTKNK